MSTTSTLFVTADAIESEGLPEIYLWDAEPALLAVDDDEETARGGEAGSWYAADPDEEAGEGMAECVKLPAILDAHELLPAPGEKYRVTITVEKEGVASCD